MKSVLLKGAMALAGLWLVLLVVFHSVLHLYRIPNGSMERTIHVGDHVITHHENRVRRGDIIAFNDPVQRRSIFLKRVIGVPGDTVEIRAKHVFIDGRELQEPYAIHMDDQIYPKNPALPEPYRSRDHFGPVMIGHDQYFVMGDNRDRSSDSRYWGTVPRDQIVGTLVTVIRTGDSDPGQ